jgi:hypothetical protein
MPDSWTISVNGHSYGPYTAEQMRAFAAEGRLAAHSLVSREGEERYQPASADSALAVLFQTPAPAKPALPSADDDAAPQTFGRHEEEKTAARTHYIVVADMKVRSISGLEEEIFKCGPAYPIMPQAWVLSSEMSLNALRNLLVQKLGKLDTLFVADTTHDKAAWFNYAPEGESRIRKIWQKPLMETPARAAG